LFVFNVFRACVCPNIGFINQLKNYEKELINEWEKEGLKTNPLILKDYTNIPLIDINKSYF
jgi:hypothetical protein